MSNILEELYYQNLEAHPVQYNEESKIGKMTAEMEKEEILLSRLKGEDRDWFHTYVEMINERTHLMNVDKFTEGVRMGAKFVKKVFNEAV